jgi:hypothetical protein
MNHSGEATEMVGNRTAVEWLINELQKTRDWQRVINEANQSSTSVRDVIDEAKEMEKEQIKEAYFIGGHQMKNNKYIGMHEYYNETYGGNK